MTESAWMIVGRVAGAFGVRGEIKVEPYTDDPNRFLGLKEVFLGPAHARFGLERSRKHKSLVILKLEGIESPEEVRALGPVDVSIPRGEALQLPEGHYFLEDMIGIEVSAEGGRHIGAITDVLRTGSNDVFVVGEGTKSVLVPAIQDAILELDLTARLVVVATWILEPYV